jgi:hypothetical protein
MVQMKRESNGVLDDSLRGHIDAALAAQAGMRTLLTTEHPGDSPNGVNPVAKDVWHQISMENIEKLRILFAGFQELEESTRPPMREMYRIRSSQSPILRDG